MLVTNLTDETIGIAGVTIPKRQQRTVRDWDRVKDSRKVRAMLDSGAISVPETPDPEPEDEPKRGFFGSLRGDQNDDDET